MTHATKQRHFRHVHEKPWEVTIGAKPNATASHNNARYACACSRCSARHRRQPCKAAFSPLNAFARPSTLHTHMSYHIIYQLLYRITYTICTLAIMSASSFLAASKPLTRSSRGVTTIALNCVQHKHSREFQRQETSRRDGNKGHTRMLLNVLSPEIPGPGATVTTTRHQTGRLGSARKHAPPHAHTSHTRT